MGPYHIVCRIIMCVIVIQVLLKTFFFLRVFPVLTPVIVMLKTVIYDLRIFMLFYTILIGGFCNVFAVLGLGNAYPSKKDVSLRYLKARAAGGSSGGGGSAGLSITEVPSELNKAAKEYNALGLHMGEFMWTLRLSIGDGSIIGASKLLGTKTENRIFWLLWILITIITSVIFLNFIVAEASASYTKVTETLE
jgi:hypothetical protein